MEDIWYYVLAGEKKGPVDISVISELITNQEIGDDDYVWKKGLDNWTKIKDLEEFKDLNILDVEEQEFPSALPESNNSSNSLVDLAGETSTIFVKIGVDRGVREAEYGPYNLEVIQKLYKENRINAKTFVFVKGMDNWQMLADFSDFSGVFEGMPPEIKDDERRSNIRKPFIARMYIQNNEDVFVGICRDISVGGMQVLVDNFPGSVGDRISINVHPENTDYHFVASGNIVRLLEGGQGFSFRFTDLPESSKESINKYLVDA